MVRRIGSLRRRPIHGEGPPSTGHPGGRGAVLKYLLDTNAVIAVLKNKPMSVRTRLERVSRKGASISISSVVLFELWYGVARSERRLENSERLEAFLSGTIEVVRFEEEDAAVAGNLRVQLEAAGTPIGAYDLLIAAQALRLGATLVTANVSEFARVPRLTCQDWSRTRAR